MGRYDPYRHARKMGVRIIRRPIIADAYWSPNTRTVILKEGLDPIRALATLAEKLAQAELGHDDPSPENMRAAEALAFENMMRGRRRVHAAIYSTLTVALAMELGTSGHLLQAILDASFGGN